MLGRTDRPGSPATIKPQHGQGKHSVENSHLCLFLLWARWTTHRHVAVWPGTPPISGAECRCSSPFWVPVVMASPPRISSSRLVPDSCLRHCRPASELAIDVGGAKGKIDAVRGLKTPADADGGTAPARLDGGPCRPSEPCARQRELCQPASGINKGGRSSRDSFPAHPFRI